MLLIEIFEDIKVKQKKCLNFIILDVTRQPLQSKDSSSGYYAQVVPALV